MPSIYSAATATSTGRGGQDSNTLYERDKRQEIARYRVASPHEQRIGGPRIDADKNS